MIWREKYTRRHIMHTSKPARKFDAFHAITNGFRSPFYALPSSVCSNCSMELPTAVPTPQSPCLNDIVPRCQAFWHKHESAPHPLLPDLTTITPCLTHFCVSHTVFPGHGKTGWKMLLGRPRSIQSLPSPASAFSANTLPAFFFFFLADFLDADAASMACKHMTYRIKTLLRINKMVQNLAEPLISH